MVLDNSLIPAHLPFEVSPLEGKKEGWKTVGLSGKYSISSLHKNEFSPTQAKDLRFVIFAVLVLARPKPCSCPNWTKIHKSWTEILLSYVAGRHFGTTATNSSSIDSLVLLLVTHRNASKLAWGAGSEVGEGVLWWEEGGLVAEEGIVGPVTAPTYARIPSSFPLLFPHSPWSCTS